MFTLLSRTEGWNDVGPIWEGNKSLNETIKANRSPDPGLASRERMLTGAMCIACAQRLIIENGPSWFVVNCINKSLHPEIAKARSRNQACGAFVAKFVFIFVVPFVVPKMLADLTAPDWGFEPEGSWHRQYKQWAGDGPAPDAGLYKNNANDILVGEATVDLSRLRLALSNASAPTAAGVIFLDGQNLHEWLYKWWLGFVVGFATVILTWVFHICCPIWAMWKAHGDWYSADPKFKYTHTTFLFKADMYKLMPCAWLAVRYSFYIGGSFIVGFVAYDSFKACKFVLSLEVTGIVMSRVWRRAAVIILGDFAFGKAYFGLASSWFYTFLGTPNGVHIVARSFEAHCGGIFLNAVDPLKSFDFLVLQRHEIDAVADDNILLLEHWLLQRALENSKASPNDKGSALRYKHAMIESDYARLPGLMNERLAEFNGPPPNLLDAASGHGVANRKTVEDTFVMERTLKQKYIYDMSKLQDVIVLDQGHTSFVIELYSKFPPSDEAPWKGGSQVLTPSEKEIRGERERQESSWCPCEIV